MTPVRLGFIGLGHITTHAHLPALAPLVDSGEVVLQAFCDLSLDLAGQRASEYGVKKIYTDFREMLDSEDLDAIYLCIPPTLHGDQISLVVARGLAVFVEKPQTLDIRQATAFDQEIAAAGVISQVGFMSRYYPTAEKVAELLRQRTPRHAQIQMFYSGVHIRYWTSRYELCGGSFVENTIHKVDLLRYFLGDISEVSAFYYSRAPGEGPEPINMPHVYNVNYRFASNVVANCTTSRVLTNVDVSQRAVLVVCDDALIEWSENRVVENGEVVFEADRSANAFALQAKAFVAAVRSNDASLTRSSYRDGLNSLAAVLGANASSEAGGKVISMHDFVPGSD